MEKQENAAENAKIKIEIEQWAKGGKDTPTTSQGKNKELEVNQSDIEAWAKSRKNN